MYTVYTNIDVNGRSVAFINTGSLRTGLPEPIINQQGFWTSNPINFRKITIESHYITIKFHNITAHVLMCFSYRKCEWC